MSCHHNPYAQYSMTTLYKIGIIFLFAALVAGHCPEQESITPCICGEIADGIALQCEGPEDTDSISSVVESFGNSQNLELVLESLSLPLSPTAFKPVSSLHLYNARIEKIRSNSSFTWPKLSEVFIQSSNIADKTLPDFKEAHLLRHLEISKIDISTIGSQFRDNIPGVLTYLDIRKTKTITLEPHALNHLKKLQYFIMVDLPLQEFPRNALPSTMPDLHTFILGNTNIKKLEINFFDGMPELEVIMLNGNKLKTLDFNLFAPIENQLTHLLAERNPLECDCNLLWLTNNAPKEGAMKVLATCEDNVTEKRKDVTVLNEDDYCR